jgi:hypothetical protein
MSIIQVLSKYCLKLQNDFKEWKIVAIVRQKPPRSLDACHIFQSV